MVDFINAIYQLTKTDMLSNQPILGGGICNWKWKTQEHKMDPQTKKLEHTFQKDPESHIAILPVPNHRSTPSVLHAFITFSVIVLVKKNDAMDIPQLRPFTSYEYLWPHV